MSEDLRLVTRRLTLVACSIAVIEALGRDRREAERLLGARLPHEWSDAELAGFLPVIAKQLRENSAALGYGVWLVVESGSGTVVGSAGFQGLPNTDGEVEIGYGVHPDFRNRGYATEAVRELTNWALGQSGVERVTAHCGPDNTPSLQVLAKSGLIRDGERNGLTRWITRQPG